MYCFVILLLFNEMQMSVRRFSAIPHLRGEMTCSGISGNRFLRTSNICPLWPFLSAAIKIFASTFCVPFFNVFFMIEGCKMGKLGKEEPQLSQTGASVNVRLDTYCA